MVRELRLRVFWGGFKGYSLVSERVPLPSSRAMGLGDQGMARHSDSNNEGHEMRKLRSTTEILTGTK